MHNNPKSTGHSEGSSEEDVHSVTGLPQEARKISDNLTLKLKELEKEQQTKSRVSRGRK